PIAEVYTRTLHDALPILKRAKDQVEEAKKGNQDASAAEKVVSGTEAELRKLRAALDSNDFKDLREQWEQREESRAARSLRSSASDRKSTRLNSSHLGISC